MKPYYQDEAVTIYHGDCREVLPYVSPETMVTDPPYPNNAGHFDDAIAVAREILSSWRNDALVFWTELECPPLWTPLVAVHIWHRTNVNGRPYEPIYQAALDGRKRRSEVIRHAAVFDGVGPGCREYQGHPTQKPLGVMRQLISRYCDEGVIVDPFCGSGTTLAAAKQVGRKAIGIEIEERYCEIAANRCRQGALTAMFSEEAS